MTAKAAPAALARSMAAKAIYDAAAIRKTGKN